MILREPPAIRAFDVETGRQCLVLAGHSDYVHASDFVYEGRDLATVDNEVALSLWRPAAAP